MGRPVTVPMLVLALCASSCGDPSPENRQPPGPDGRALVELDFDRKDSRPFVEFYFSSFVEPGRSIYDEDLIVTDGDDFLLDLDRLRSNFPAARELEEEALDGVLTWEEMKDFFGAHYYEAIDAPTSLSALLDDAETDSGVWMELEVDGVMTEATRHVLVPAASVRSALERFGENGNRLLYPKGTVFVADHLLDNSTVETTAMRKRADGLWDYLAFDAEGNLAPATTSPPKPLSVPTQCVGCHLGSRLYEPEKSFPAEARPGPEGPRKIFVDDRVKNGAVVRFLDEHRKRSDGILGLYGTVFLSDLVASRADGTIRQADAALLDKLGL